MTQSSNPADRFAFLCRGLCFGTRGNFSATKMSHTCFMHTEVSPKLFVHRTLLALKDNDETSNQTQKLKYKKVKKINSIQVRNKKRQKEFKNFKNYCFV
jgi:hypothetical protein